MQEELFKFVSATFGVSAAVTLAVILLALWLTHYVTKKAVSIGKDHSALRGSMEKTEANIDEIRRDLAYLKGNIEIFRSSGGNLIQAHSPLSLTEEGKKVAAELKADAVISRSWDRIKRDIEASGKVNAYDIQEYCIETASVDPEKFLDKEAIDSIKDFAYNNGKPLQLYLRVIGILIRDRYLEGMGITRREQED